MKNLVSIYLLVLCSLFAKDPPEISTEAMKQPSTGQKTFYLIMQKKQALSP